MIRDGKECTHISRLEFAKSIIIEKVKRGIPMPAGAVKVTLQESSPEFASHKPIYAYINHGRWVADCPFCPGAELVWKDDPTFICFSCYNAQVDCKPIKVKFPKPIHDIERELNKRPLAPNQNWRLGESVANLRAENKKMGVK